MKASLLSSRDAVSLAPETLSYYAQFTGQQDTGDTSKSSGSATAEHDPTSECGSCLKAKRVCAAYEKA
jgi:hypothetical protein